MLTRSCRLASLLLTVAAYASVCPAEPAARPDVPMPALQEEIWVLPLPLPSIAYVVRPAGKGPFPLAIMNHGVAMDPRERSSLWSNFGMRPSGSPVAAISSSPLPDLAMAPAAWIFRSGLMVCSFPRSENAPIPTSAMPGWRSRSTTLKRSDIRPTRSSFCLTVQLSSDSQRGAGGQSRSPARTSPGVKAVVVFAGGRGGRVDGKPNNNCAPDRLVATTAEFGQTARVPMLWIYTRNDTFFGPELSTRMHEAFVRRRRQCRIPPAGRFSEMMATF